MIFALLNTLYTFFVKMKYYYNTREYILFMFRIKVLNSEINKKNYNLWN